MADPEEPSQWSLIRERYGSAETQWSFKNIPIGDQHEAGSNNSSRTTVGHQGGVLRVAQILDVPCFGANETTDIVWPFMDLWVDEAPQAQAPAADRLALELQHSILSYIVDWQDSVNIDITTAWGTNESHFTNGVPQVFRDLNGVFRINRQLGKPARDWVFKVAKFEANERNFHHFPALVGSSSGRIKHLHIALNVCNFSDGDRAKLVETLVQSLTGLDLLELVETLECSTKLLNSHADLIGSRHKSLRFACNTVRRHRSLKRALVRPVKFDGQIFTVEYQLDTGKHPLPRRLQALPEDSEIRGDRKESLVLNATVVCRTPIRELRVKRFQEVSIQPGPGQTTSNIISSEVPTPDSHYAILDQEGFRVQDGAWCTVGSSDNWLFEKCKDVDKATNPVLYLMQEYAKMKLKLEEVKHKQQESDAALLDLQHKLDDRDQRLSEISVLASKPWTGKRKVRQARSQVSSIVKVAQGPEPWSDVRSEGEYHW